MIYIINRITDKMCKVNPDRTEAGNTQNSKQIIVNDSETLFPKASVSLCLYPARAHPSGDTCSGGVCVPCFTCH